MLGAEDIVIVLVELVLLGDVEQLPEAAVEEQEAPVEPLDVDQSRRVVGDGLEQLLVGEQRVLGAPPLDDVLLELRVGRRERRRALRHLRLEEGLSARLLLRAGGEGRERPQIRLEDIPELAQEPLKRRAIPVLAVVQRADRAKEIPRRPGDRESKIGDHPQLDVRVRLPALVLQRVGDEQWTPRLHHRLAVEPGVEASPLTALVRIPLRLAGDTDDELGRLDPHDQGGGHAHDLGEEIHDLLPLPDHVRGISRASVVIRLQRLAVHPPIGCAPSPARRSSPALHTTSRPSGEQASPMR